MPASATAELEAALKIAQSGSPEAHGAIATRAHYAPPWADVSIIGIAGSSGSGKSTLSQAIVSKLNLPWVVILSIVSIAAMWFWISSWGQTRDWL
jgi:uridine kinase